MAIEGNLLFIYGIGIVALYYFGRLFFKPMKYIFIFLWNILLGGLGLLLVNYIGSFFQYHIAINYMTVAISGFLGVPGVILLAALKAFFVI